MHTYPRKIFRASVYSNLVKSVTIVVLRRSFRLHIKELYRGVEYFLVSRGHNLKKISVFS